MRARGIVRIVVGGVLLLVGIAVLCAFLLGFDFGSLKGVGHVDRGNLVTIKEQTVTQEVTSVEANWIDGRLDVLESEDDTVQIVQTGRSGMDEGKLFEAVLDGDALRIKDRRGGFVLSLMWTPSDLKIYLPKRQYESIALKTVSADLKTVSLAAEHLDISTTSGVIDTSGTVADASVRSVSGDILAQGLTAQNAGVSTTSGRMQVAGAVQNLVARTVSGDISINGKTSKLTAKSTSGRITTSGSGDLVEASTVSGEIDIASTDLPQAVSAGSTSGNITLTLPESDGFSVRFSTTSGSFRSELPMTENQKVHQYGEGGPGFEVKTVSGDLAVKKAL